MFFIRTLFEIINILKKHVSKTLEKFVVLKKIFVKPTKKNLKIYLIWNVKKNAKPVLSILFLILNCIANLEIISN